MSEGVLTYNNVAKYATDLGAIGLPDELNGVDPAVDRSADARRNIFLGNADKEYGTFEDQDDATNTLPGSLFYEAQSSEDGRTGLFNYYIIGDSRKAKDGIKLRYDLSETFAHNQMVTEEISRNPTAHAIISTTTSNGAYLDPKSKYVSQPYNVKDFIFCKHYGVIKNNKMITLRRFPNPVMDNLRVPLPGNRIEPATKDGKLVGQDKHNQGITSEEMKQTGACLPIAQAVTFFGEGTGNDLSSILSVDTGLNWKPLSQQKRLDINGNDPGLIAGLPAKYMQAIAGKGVTENLEGISNVIGTFTDPDNIDQRIRRTYWQKLTQDDGPLTQRLFVDVNTVNQMYIRDLGFKGGDQSFNLTFTYNLTSVGTTNSRMLFIDLLANLLAIGSDYGTFLSPQLLVNSKRQGIGFPGGSAGYVKFLTKPVEYLNDMITAGFDRDLKEKKKQLDDRLKQAQKELAGLNKNIPLPKDGVIYKTLSALLTSQLIEQIKYEPIMLSGYPTGEWHVVVGNPLNPIAMMGNLICENIQIKLNTVLGPDDFPTEMTAIYRLKPARQRHRGDFESMFNRGKGRLYLGKMTIADQSKGVLVTAQTGNDIIAIPSKDVKEVFPKTAVTWDVPKSGA